MAPYLYPPGPTFEAVASDDPWPDSSSMQRSSSQSTAYTVDSNYTASTDLTDYSACHDPSASLYQYAYGEPPDTEHLLCATGSQYHHNNTQLRQSLQLYSPLQLFYSRIGSIENAARQATESARFLISSQGSYGLAGLSVITSDAVEEALRRLQEQGQDSSPRAAVQHVLRAHLYRQFRDMDMDPLFLTTDPLAVLEEAAYQLQLCLQGPKVLGICYYAIVAVLAQLARDLEAADELFSSSSSSPHPDTLSPAVAASTFQPFNLPMTTTTTTTTTRRSPPTGSPIQTSTSIPSTSTSTTRTTTTAPAEKERYPCLIPGCAQKCFSRSADLDRHHKMVHVADAEKKKYACDYRKCPRHRAPFFRPDHFRDHLRLFHKEDLLLRGARGRAAAGDRGWWESRSPRALFSGWWRCNRCLVVRVDERRYGWVCPGCGNPCEGERRRERERMRREAAASAS